MCGSASERTRAISWGEMVIEEFPAIRRCAAGGNVAAPFSEPPARAKEALTPVARVFLLVMPGLDPGIHQKSISSKRMDCRVKPGNDGGVSVPNAHESEKASLSRPALLDEPCDGGSQFGDAGAGARGGHEYLRMSRGMLGESCLGRGDERRELGGLGRVGFGQHDLVVDRGLVQGLEHVGVDRLEAMAGVNEEVGAREIGASQEKGMDQRGPRPDLRLRGRRVTVTRHVDERELRRPGEKDQLLRAARRMRGAREGAPPGKRVDQARLADIGAAGNGNLDTAHARQRRGRSSGGGELPIAREQLAAGFHLGAGERGGGSWRLRAAHDDEPLTPGSLFFLVKRVFRASHVRLRLSNSSTLAPCLCMMKLCWATESVLFQAQ